jgi:hypothetical protein
LYITHTHTHTQTHTHTCVYITTEAKLKKLRAGAQNVFGGAKVSAPKNAVYKELQDAYTSSLRAYTLVAWVQGEL